jgi:hypothetical protein
VTSGGAEPAPVLGGGVGVVHPAVTRISATTMKRATIPYDASVLMGADWYCIIYKILPGGVGVHPGHPLFSGPGVVFP